VITLIKNQYADDGNVSWLTRKIDVVLKGRQKPAVEARA